MSARASISRWKTRHAAVVWIGILLNLGFALPLIFCPDWILGLFDIRADQRIWPRFAGLLLLILSVFYIPGAVDVDRYRIPAWLAVFPSRSLGVIFFSLAVLVYDQPVGFLSGVLLDGVIGVASLWCLIRLSALEQQVAEGRP